MTALVLLLLLVAGPVIGEPQTIDVIHLKDGTTLSGLIVEQEAGISVKLASADGIVWTLEDQEIDVIEKEPAPDPLMVQYTDVVLLKDGVLFRGSVVEQRPGDSIVLRTSSSSLLTIPIADVWAFVKRKQVVGTAPAPALAVDTKTEPLRIRLQIEIGKKPIAMQGVVASGARGGGETGGSASSLEEETTTLERERDKADHRAKDEERNSERQALETLDKDITGLLDRLLADLQECGRQGGVGKAGSPFRPATYQPASTAEATPVAELASRYTGLLHGVVDRAVAKIPTDEVIAARERQVEDCRAVQTQLTTARSSGRVELNRIRTLAARLPAEERQRLYEINQRRDGLKGALLNTIPFAMAGSWSQGDNPTGRLGSILFLASGVIDLAMIAFNYNPTAVSTPWGWTEMWNDPVNPIFWVGPACYAASYAVGIILPPVRANTWNTALAKALQVDKTVQREPAAARVGFPPVAVAPGSREEPRLEVHLLSLRY
jgi:hypothetical protein